MNNTKDPATGRLWVKSFRGKKKKLNKILNLQVQRQLWPA